MTSTERQAPPAGPDEEEGAPIPALDLGVLEAYVGIAGATVDKPSVGTPSAAAAAAAAGGGGAALGPGLVRLETGMSDLSAAAGSAAAAGGGEAAGEQAARGWESDGDSVRGAAAAAAAAGGAAKEGDTAAQAAARAAFRRDTGALAMRPRPPTSALGLAPSRLLASLLCWHPCSAGPRVGQAWHALPTTPSLLSEEDDFFSSDEEESGPTEADARSQARCPSFFLFTMLAGWPVVQARPASQVGQAAVQAGADRHPPTPHPTPLFHILRPASAL